MAKQLQFTGHPDFAPSSFDRLLKHLYVEPLIAHLKRDSSVLGFGYSLPAGPRHEVQRLFTPPPTCTHYHDLDEVVLDCHFDTGHSGPHYDAYRRIEWGDR